MKTKLPVTDHQIFERYHKFSIKKAIRKQNITLKELTTLSVGDYVTH
jgi:transcription-repair coupling factor (superfamily II helicase)